LDVLDSAIIEFNLGNFKKALDLFNKVIESEPCNITALIKKGNILGKFARYNDAILCYDKVLQIEPKNNLALINKGLALHYLGDFLNAISCYDLILITKPDSSLTLYNKASSLIRNNQISEGLEYLKNAIKLDFSCKYKARYDIDFEQVKKTPEFKKLVL